MQNNALEVISVIYYSNRMLQKKTAFHFVKTCSNSENLQQTNQGYTGV